MYINDFQYMWRGKTVKSLLPDEVHLLKPLKIKKENGERALLLLHGYSSSPAVYRELIPQITQYDEIFCPNLAGHGENIQEFSKSTAKDWLSSVKKAYATLSQTYSTIDVMGLSLGGLLAYYLSQEVKINHLYLLAPAFVLKSNVRINLNLAKLLDHLGFKYLRNRAGNLHTQKHAELTYRLLPLTTIIEILSLIKNTRFKPVTCPVDVFLGRYDEVVDSTRVAELFNYLPTIQIHWLENSAHILPLDDDLAEIAHTLNKL